jgi:hypothetical protein
MKAKKTPAKKGRAAAGKKSRKPAAARATPKTAEKEPGPEVPLANGLWEKFCCIMAAGSRAQAAYLEVFPHVKPRSAQAQASLLLSNLIITARIEHLKKQINAKLEEAVVVKKSDFVTRLFHTLDIPITEVMRAMKKAEAEESEEDLSPRERMALLLCMEKGETMFGPRYKMIGLLDRMKQIGGWLGWEGKEIELGSKTISEFASIWAEIRMGRTTIIPAR